MKQYFLEKGRIFSIRKLTVGVASVAVGLAFFASGNVAASELVTEPKLEVDGQAKEVADTNKETPEVAKEVAEKPAPLAENAVEESGDLLPEEIPDRAYPDTPVKKLDTSAIVSEKESPQVETKSILKPTEVAPSESEKENRAIINGGQDLKHINYDGQPATSAAMVYTIFSSPLAGGGTQRYLNSGSGIFVAPNIMLTVAHNFLKKDAETNAGNILGGDTAKFYYNVGSNSAKNNSLPTSGKTVLFQEKDIHFWNKEKFGEGYKNDLALVVAPVPVQIASPNKAATFTPLAEYRTYNPGEPVSTIGYPTDSTSPELKEPIVPGQLYKADGVVKGTEKYDDKGTVGVTYRLTSVSGLSGGGIINGDGKVIGIHQRGTVDNMNIPEKDRFGGGLVLSPEQLAWVKEIIDKYGVKGWYQGDNGSRYYFTPEGEMLRNKTAVIGENKYSFDESGVATLLEGVEYGRVVIEHVDQKDNPVKENDTFVEKTEVGTQFDYNYKTEIEKTDFFKKNKEKYEIVSIDGKAVNKQLKDAWGEDYSVVSKAPAGTRVIKVVYKVNKGSFDLRYRLKGTEQELAPATVDNNEGKEYEVSFVHRFQAKEITGYRAVNASQEATIQHKGVNQVIFEYEKIEDPKPVTPVTPVVDPKDEETEIAAYGPLPSKAQLDYHKEELAAFIHYGMNTYTNSEWGNGRENPQNFNPTNLDTDQWIKTLKDAGFKRTIMVVKHHDGFVIYPSKYTKHTVAASPWKDGKGDLLEEISKSATKYDMNMGVYLSPWDANNPKYHVSTEKEYNEYYLNQLKEILGNPKYGNNGKFIEVWMDGARGSGAQKVTYTFDEWFKYIKEAEGDIAIFSAQPTSVRWIGNERGIAGDPVWHKVKKAKITDDVRNDYLNHGDPDGDMYSVGEADVSIRSGWFYHDNQQPKSIKDLMDIYFKSVGRGTPLLLNIPPNKEGKFADADVARLKEFRATLDQMYATDFAKGATVTASSTRKNHLYQASHLTDGKDDTSWALANDAKTGEFTVDLGQKRRFDVIELKEDIAKGQRISGFKVEVELNGRWVPYGEGSTIGYRRLIQGQPVEAQKIRVTITGAQATPILTNFSVYKTPSSIEKTDGYPLGLDYHSNTTADKANTTWYDESEGIRGTSMWTNQKDASVTYRFNGTKAYVVSTVDPNHGEMSVYVDGQKVADVQTNNAARKRSQMVYETDDLAPGEHTIKLVNKTGKAIATEGIYTLNNAGKGMFELKETTYEVQKGQPVTVTIKRVGGSKGAATVHVVTEPGTGVHGKVYKDTTADLTFQDGETEKTLTIPTIDFTEQADSIFDFKVKMTSASDEALLGFASEATIRVMKAELLQKDQVSHDDQASQLDYSPGWHHETNSSGKYQNTESWASFGRLTEEQKKNASVTAYFYGTGLEIKGFVDPGHGIYKVTLDGKELEYQDGQGNATDVNGKKYFSGTATTRQGDQTLVRLTGLEEGWHAVTLQLDPKRNDTSRNIGIQVDKFITRGEDSALYTKEELVQAMKNWKDELAKFDQTALKNTPEARQAFKSNLDKLSEQLSASSANAQEVLKTATVLQTILDKEENYGVEETPAQPEEPNYDKAMASLAEAIQNKSKELGDDKEAKKKLVELSEQALAAIEAAKTQDAVDKALQAALTSINQLQATPKEEPKPEPPAQPEEPNYDKAMASLAEAIQNKSKELGNDKEAKKKLVELSEQAIAAIEAAKTQDAVDKALATGLAAINQLQATPKEEPKPEEPSKPEEPTIDYDKAMASLGEAIERKTKELGDDKEAKKKLVELAEQAVSAIQEAKTQDAVDKALATGLAAINQLQATPKEEPKPEEPSKPEEPTIDYDKAMASLGEAIERKTKELGDDKEAKKKLVELSEQALAAIEEAKSQDAVDKALATALAAINQLQATPKEDPKPEESKVDRHKAIAELAAAVEKKAAELVDDVAAQEKLVELGEQALTAIRDAKTQDAVDKALQAALTFINQLQATPKEEVKHSTVPAEGDKVLVQTQPSLEVTTEPIAFNTVRRENAFLAKGKEQVVSEGKAGQVTTYVEVEGDTRKTVKVEREEAQDRVIEVGTYEGTSEPAEGVKELSFSQPSLEVVEEPRGFKTVKQEDPTLPEGKTSVSQVGREGKERIITEVALDGSRTEKLREVVEEPQDEIVLVGTKKFETGKTDPAIHEVAEFTGGVNGTEAASHELPEFTGGVNGSEAVIRGEDPEFTGGVNGTEAASHELPEFTGGVNGSEAVVRGENPEFTGGVNGTEAASHELPEFTGGVNGSEAVVRGEDPEFTGGVNGTEAASHELLEFTGGVNGSEAVIRGEDPEFTGGVNGTEAASHELPEFTVGVNGSEAASHELPEFTGGVNGSEAAIHDVPEFTGGVNGAEATVHELPEYKDEQSHVAQAMSQEKTYQAPANRQDILPETGAKETATLASLGAVGALLGLAAMGKKKEDE
ncbi:SIALI-17 repeat-containing surface protein [Streptococcus infantis]|uniref:SIALI-17 repeat-containing surface protein n=1 Tax=Streptococcus infantis TaxID=68892 RepID=UPI0039C098E4